ncbi:MAG: hypothetical protein R3F39_03260 [Myxococcota bacterium]
MIERVRSMVFAGALVLATGALVVGCKKSDEPAKPVAAVSGEKAPAAEGAKPAEGDKPVAAEGDKPAAEGDKPAAEGNKPAAGEGGDKAEIGKTYIEVYCAQKAGETEKLFDIYAAHGFTDPATWTKVWTEAAKDKPWVARVTQDALRACP